MKLNSVSLEKLEYRFGLVVCHSSCFITLFCLLKPPLVFQISYVVKLTNMYWNINKCCNLLHNIILFPMQTQLRLNVNQLHSNVVQTYGALCKFELNNYNVKNSKELKCGGI